MTPRGRSASPPAFQRTQGWGTTMELALYTSTAGRCVLVPDCFLPSAESERRYGPLRRCGSVHLAEPVDDALWQRVLAELDRRSFAVLRRNDARRLLDTVDG